MADLDLDRLQAIAAAYITWSPEGGIYKLAYGTSELIAEVRRLTAENEQLRETADDVVRDYGETCCDHVNDCACSMARLSRMVRPDAGL